MPFNPAGPSKGEPKSASFEFRFTPAEWRLVLEDRSFLSDRDNAYSPPRRLLGVPVRIVPDHGFD